MNDLSGSGIEGGFGSTLPMIKWLTSSIGNSLALSKILKESIEEKISLCLSNIPLLVYWKAVYVMDSMRFKTLFFKDLGVN